MEDMIIKLQTIVEHQGEEISSLSQELYLQQQEIAALRQQFLELKERFQSLENEVGNVDASLEPPPPHY